MTEDCGFQDAKLQQSIGNDVRLRFGGAVPVSRQATMAKTGTVKNQHAVMSAKAVQQTAAHKVFSHAAVAVQQNDGRAFAQVQIVKSGLTHSQKCALWRYTPLCPTRKQGVYRSNPHKRGGAKYKTERCPRRALSFRKNTG